MSAASAGRRVRGAAGLAVALLLAVSTSVGCGAGGRSRPEQRQTRPNEDAQGVHPAPGPAPSPSPGVPGRCLQEGEGSTDFDDARSGARPECCAGLQKLYAHELPSVETGACIASKGGRYACARCGDGLCRPAESRCNCPADCR